MFPLPCPARARLPGIILCLAPPAPAGLALGPPSFPSCSIPAGPRPQALPRNSNFSIPQDRSQASSPSRGLWASSISEAFQHSGFGYGGGVGQGRFQNLWQLYSRGFFGGIWVYYEFRRPLIAPLLLVRPWDWLPCDWMCPITKEATSKTHPPYDSLQTPAMASSFLRLPSPMGLMALKHRGKTATFGFLSRLYSLTGLGLRDLGDCWSFGVSLLFPCPLKLGLWTGLFVCSFASGLILAGCMSCS
jgi:hypothetical protein